MVHTPAATRWSRLIDEQEAAGLSLRDFAAERDLKPSTLAWWRSRLGWGRTRVEVLAAQPVFDQLTVDSTGPAGCPKEPSYSSSSVSKPMSS